MSYILVEYLCGTCKVRDESLESRPAPRRRACRTEGCRGRAQRVISAVRYKTVYASAVTRAKSDPLPGPLAMDTRELGEGRPKADWKKERRRLWKERDWARLRAAR